VIKSSLMTHGACVLLTYKWLINKIAISHALDSGHSLIFLWRKLSIHTWNVVDVQFGIGWWIIIDAAIAYPSQDDFHHACHICGVLGTVALFM